MYSVIMYNLYDTFSTEAGIMPLSYGIMSLVLPRDISTNHHVSNQPGPKINDKHDKDKLEFTHIKFARENHTKCPVLCNL